MDGSTWRSLVGNVRDLLFPEKQAPLRLTSKPVPVKDIWGESDNHGKAGTASLLVHGAMIAGLIAVSLMGTKVVQQVKKQEQVTLVAPDVSVYMPMVQKPAPAMGGGGGGGDHDVIRAPKGRLPKIAPQQITPPEVVLRNDHPKLAVEPTIVMPPTVHVADNHMPDLGNPRTNVVGPASNGTGSRGGIGSGAGGGIGSGSGIGHGPGQGAGYGGGLYKVGGGVSAPKAIYSPDPEYSEEARRAKYQGEVLLWIVVGPDGRVRDVKVQRPVGMGLDEKAMQAVRQWKFDPATKDGHPVAVGVTVEVGFHLY